jgi:hypothetical protein
MSAFLLEQMEEFGLKSSMWKNCIINSARHCLIGLTVVFLVYSLIQCKDRPYLSIGSPIFDFYYILLV